MKKELQEKLYTDFPKLYRQHSLSASESCMHWGFQCDDGWYSLIYDLSECIQRYVDWTQPYQPELLQPEATCVKEKLGRLCWYVKNSNDHINGMISFAVHMSLKTCEVCSQPGKKRIKNDFLEKTVCNECAKRLKFDDEFGD